MRHLADVLRPRVETIACAIRADAEAELCRDNDLFADGSERFTNELLILEWAVRFGSIEQRDTSLDSRADDRNSFRPAGRGSVDIFKTHAAVANRRDREIVFAES